MHDQPGEHDRTDVRRRVREAGHRLEADRQQDACEHRPGQRRRDPGDQVAERRHEAGEQDQDPSDHEGTDRGRPAAGDSAGRDEQRRPRGRPGERDRGAVPDRQPQHAERLRHEEDQQPGRRLGGRGPDGGQPGQHDDEGAAGPDDRRDDPGDDRVPSCSLTSRSRRGASTASSMSWRALGSGAHPGGGVRRLVTNRSEPAPKSAVGDQTADPGRGTPTPAPAPGRHRRRPGCPESAIRSTVPEIGGGDRGLHLHRLDGGDRVAGLDLSRPSRRPR